MILIKITSILDKVKPIADLMQYHESEIYESHRHAVAQEVLNEMAAVGMKVGESYESLEIICEYLQTRKEILELAIMKLKDMSMHSIADTVLETSSLHME